MVNRSQVYEHYRINRRRKYTVIVGKSKKQMSGSKFADLVINDMFEDIVVIGKTITAKLKNKPQFELIESLF